MAPTPRDSATKMARANVLQYGVAGILMICLGKGGDRGLRCQIGGLRLVVTSKSS